MTRIKIAIQPIKLFHFRASTVFILRKCQLAHVLLVNLHIILIHVTYYLPSVFLNRMTSFNLKKKKLENNCIIQF